MAEILESERRDPVLPPATGSEVRAAFEAPLPLRGRPPAEILEQCRGALRRYSRRNGHPRFFGYVCASAAPLGALADGLASLLNQIPTAWRSAPAATEVEHLVVRWLDAMVGFGGGGRGLLVSGGSAANLHGLACAVARAEQRAGLGSGERRRLTLYFSREGHLSLTKAARLLGLAEGHVRVLGVDAERLIIELVEHARRGPKRPPSGSCGPRGYGSPSTTSVPVHRTCGR